ncbi:membrane protein insertion efficiency factor YidD [Tenacibaculum singaporense]|uniref:Membrane protein insertion efficiency factor YidD n=1 Tax=Tenacibaculum singaporense TaxID=2358479 RepID=A0A451EMI0_9FLAO|nr:membrane protein insertion efficiency factor YidD [Tenacibaculum singaporense]
MAKLYLLIVWLYKKLVSPIWSKFFRCRFYPTCSEYSKRAVKKYGLKTGLKMTINRLSRCKVGNHDSCIDLP